MPNPHRGEIEAVLDGRAHRLCLTLGALAELETAFSHDDMLALAERFQGGRLSARDAQRIIGAGLRGAGTDIADEAVGHMQADGGAAGYVDIVARLLNATFGGAPPSTTAPPGSTRLPSPSRGGDGGGGGETEPSKPDTPASPEGRAAPVPFPGTT